MRKLIQRSIQWIPVSSTSVWMLHSWLHGQGTQAVISTGLTALTALWVKFSGKFMETLEAEAEKRGEATAKTLIELPETLQEKSAERQQLTEFQREYYQQLVYSCRDYQTQGLDKDRVLKLEKVFVPLKIVAKETVRIDPKMIQAVNDVAHNPAEKEIWDFLVAMQKEPGLRRMAVLGAPGSGKTTLLRYLTLTYATNTQPKPVPKLIPVLLYLRDVRREIVQHNPPLAKLIEKQVKGQRKIQPLNPPSNWFAERLKKNQYLVMLDGLDEVADERERKKVRRWVDEQMQAYPDTPFILTSRPFGYQSAQMRQAVLTLEVQPFNLKQMQRFLQSWYLQTEIMSRAGEDDLGVREEAKQQADDLIERILNSKPLCDMAVNPLLLTMIATVHRRGNALPGKRVELYKEICHVLLEKRQRAKFSRNSEDLNDLLTAPQKQSVLQVLALKLMQHKTREFKVSQAASLIRDQLTLVAGNKVTPGKFLEQIKDVSGLLIEKGIGIYEFAHLSFQEYLAAVQIEALNQENLLIQNIHDSWWAETIRLYVANNDATEIIQAAMNKRTIFTLTLAYDCLDERLSINPKLQKKMEEWFKDALESSNPKIAQLAANVQLKRRLR